MATLSAAATASARTEDEHEYERTDEREGDGDDGELEDFAMSSEDEGGGGREPALDEAMMNELLLVCSNLGMLRVQNEGEEPVLMRGEDCDAWIHDLQRAIRRDHVKHKLVAKQLGKWKVLQKKLLPLLVNHQHDWELVFSILKVLVMLTMKPAKDSTNIAEQLKYLRAYKHEFLRQGIIPIMMNILVEPLSRRGSSRTPQDYLNMEIVLTLIRNLLAIPNQDPRFVTSTTVYLSHLQESLIYTLHQESVYEMILLFTQDIDSSENREWNLMIMEMIDLTLSGTRPKEVAAFFKQTLMEGAPSSQPVPPTASTAGTAAGPSRQARPSRQTSSSEGGSLLQQLKSEKSSKPRAGASRHSNFGGIVTMKGPTGRETVITQLSQAADGAVHQAPKKPVSRRRGKQQNQPLSDINEIFGSKEIITASDETTMRVIVEICNSLTSKSYFQLMNSLKTEFRRGSTKLVSTDRLQYFHLVWFLTSYHRMKIQALKSHYKHLVKAHEKKKEELLAAMDFDSPQPPEPKKPDYEEKAVLATLDMFSFNFVLQSVENFASVKNYHGMTVSVQLLTEMMSYIAEMASSDDVRFQRIADSLQHKIFYERDFLDRLPVLLKTWTPGSFSHDYVTDVVTLTHLVFKVLDTQGNIKVLSRRKTQLERKKSKKPREEGEEASDDESTDEEESERQAQLLLEMQRKEADFDVRRYFSSIVSSDTIKMYCHLLATYRENSPKVNHYIHSFFYRVKHFQINQSEEWTMQPLLFNIHVLMLFNKMLQDASIARDSAFRGFLDFIRGIVRDYFTLADKNHLLFVESLLRQTYASRSCLLIQRSYDPLDSMSRSKAEAVALGREKKIALMNEARRQMIAMDHEELEGEAEFQFSLEPSDFQASSLVSSMRAGGEEGDRNSAGPHAAVTTDSAAPSASEGPSKQPKKRASTKAAVERAKNWTRVEDRYLAKMFMKYRHLPSVYEVISYEDMFQDRDRTPEQIERRVKYLKLHRKTHDSSDEEEQKSSDDEDMGDDVGSAEGVAATMDTETPSASQRPRRRLRRTVNSGDGSFSESEDDLMLGDGGVQADAFRQSPRPDASPPDDTMGETGNAGKENEEGEPATESTNSTEHIAPTEPANAEDQDNVAAMVDKSTADAEASDAEGDTQFLEDETQEAGTGVSIDSSDAAVDGSGGSPTAAAGASAAIEHDSSLKRSRDPELDGSELDGASPTKKIARAGDASPTALDSSDHVDIRVDIADARVDG